MNYFRFGFLVIGFHGRLIFDVYLVCSLVIVGRLLVSHGVSIFVFVNHFGQICLLVYYFIEQI